VQHVLGNIGVVAQHVQQVLLALQILDDVGRRSLREATSMISKMVIRAK
jgi:DNA/RNA-binding domain of Phe-tRNA-synthetase-like protein